MSISILLDKSALEGFREPEILTLHRHYFICIAPVLVWEIAADLSKASLGDGAAHRVRMLAQKLPPFNGKVNAHHRSIAAYSLEGQKFPFGRTFVFSAPIIDNGRDFGDLVTDSPEERAVFRWRNGQFDDSDRIFAIRWREMLKTIDLDGLRKSLGLRYKATPCARDFAELKIVVDDYIAAPARQFILMVRLLSHLGLHTVSFWRAVKKRWREGRQTSLADFAPYAYYCAKALAAFEIGLLNGLITPRRTNRIDLEYLFYLPFCQVFASGDAQQIGLARVLLTPEQQFVHGSILKADIKAIRAKRDAMTDSEREELDYEYGPYPPEDSQSVTFQLWQRYMPKRSGPAGNQVARMSKEQKDALSEQFRPAMDAINRMPK